MYYNRFTIKNKEGLNGYRKANKSIRIDTGSYRDYSTGRNKTNAKTKNKIA
jgi:hypothetical protein